MIRRLPITDAPAQQMSLRTEGRRLTLRLRLSATTDRWSFDLALDDAWILYGRRIALGRDMLAAFDLGAGALIAWPLRRAAVPSRAGLTDGGVGLYHVTR